MIRTALAACIALGLAMIELPAIAQTRTPHEVATFEIYKELVEINTVTATGDTAAAADAMAARLLAAGFPPADVKVFKPAPRKGNLVARLRGSGARKPILLVAHLDVVEALRDDWSVDPFKLIEKDGYYYGRGSGDDKFMAAAFVSNLIRMRREGFRPDRDLVVVLETDEEILDANALGMRWLLKNHRDLLDADFALNEGAGVGMTHGKAITVGVQSSEKVSMTYVLEVKNAGGHSSLPVKDNAITRLGAALVRLGEFDFPVRLSETTRASMQRSAALRERDIGADMLAAVAEPMDMEAVKRLSKRAGFNAQFRTTCVATMLSGGHATNALPQTATATVNCRVLPGEPLDEVQRTLVRVVADEHVAVKPMQEATLSPPSALRPDLMGTIEKVAAEFWPGAVVLPTMLAAATDGSHLRNAGIPTYGHSGLAFDNDQPSRAHGKDERILVKSFYDGVEYLYRLVKALSSGS